MSRLTAAQPPTAVEGLDAATVAILDSYNIEPHEWIALQGFDDETWRGDRCGCIDDRCIGYHHDAHEECSCLPSLIEHRRSDLEELRRVGIEWDLAVLADRMALVAANPDLMCGLLVDQVTDLLYDVDERAWWL